MATVAASSLLLRERGIRSHPSPLTAARFSCPRFWQWLGHSHSRKTARPCRGRITRPTRAWRPTATDRKGERPVFRVLSLGGLNVTGACAVTAARANSIESAESLPACSGSFDRGYDHLPSSENANMVILPGYISIRGRSLPMARSPRPCRRLERVLTRPRRPRDTSTSLGTGGHWEH
jgi:hypothetical protein